MSERNLDGYPDSCGSHRTAVHAHVGPASYTQISRGTPPTPATGGDTLQAVQCGMKQIEWVGGQITDSGNYRVDAIPVSASGALGQQSTTYRLKWTALVTATLGGQSQTINTDATTATDLSAEVVRLYVRGYK
jgi:hypothetical protein